MKSILNLVVLDNGGETLDRYTIIDRSTGDVITANSEGHIPTGFEPECVNIAHEYWGATQGTGWQIGLDAKTIEKRIKQAVDIYLQDVTVGDVLPFKELPENVQRFAREAFIN